MDIKEQKRFIFKDIKVEDRIYNFAVVADNKEGAKQQLKDDLGRIIELI